MPFGFLFGRKKQELNSPNINELDDEVLSAVDSMMEEDYDENGVNDVYFMNPAYGAPSPSPSFHHSHSRRQYSRRSSSKVREYKRQCSLNASGELDVDVLLSPSAFAFHAIPNDPGRASFCSRDDSEIATRTVLECHTPDGRSSVSSCMRNPHINAMYLSDWRDDSEVGSCTLDKIPLRHMGSAMSYRLSISGTPECSVYGDDDVEMPGRPGHRRRHSDMSDSLNGVKERNKMIRLESIVGQIQRNNDSLFEFGVINSDFFDGFDNQREGGLLKSASAELPKTFTPGESITEDLSSSVDLPDNLGQQLSSYPLFLTNILEEEEEEEENDDTKTIIKVDAVLAEEPEKEPEVDQQPLAYTTEPDACVYESSYKLSMEPIAIDDDAGFKNPFFGMEEEPSPFYSEPEAKRTLKKTTSIKMSKKHKKKGSIDMPSRRRKEGRDESLHVALMERYLVQSVFNKYMME